MSEIYFSATGKKKQHIVAPPRHFPSETSRDGATWWRGCGSASDWRWREGSSGNLLLDSLPFCSSQRTNSSVPHRQTDGRSLPRQRQQHQHRENKLSLAAALEATNGRGAARCNGERQVLPCAVNGQWSSVGSTERQPVVGTETALGARALKDLREPHV